MLALVAGGVFAAGESAQAAGTAITLTSSSASVPSNTLVTYTLTVSCSTTGGCTNSKVAFPTTALTGDGAVTDFGPWVKNVSCPTMTDATGLVTFTYGMLATGTSQCTFTVRAPEYTTLDGAQATITPTLTSDNSDTSTATPVVLSLMAGHNDSAFLQDTGNVLAGGTFTFNIVFACGLNNDYVGDVGLSALHIESQLPANFTYTGYTLRDTLTGTFTPPAVGSSGGTFSYTGDGKDCGNPPLNNSNAIVITISGTAAASGVPDVAGDSVCPNTATATFTYIDGTAGTSSAPTAGFCRPVIAVSPKATKTAVGGTIPNAGQYTFGGAPIPYTYPGNWNGAANAAYNLGVSTSTDTVGAGVSYDIKDPLPCFDNLAAGVYSSNVDGVACAHPAFIPTGVTVTQGFTPTTSDVITLLYSDGTTGTVPYVAGAGWAIPTSPAVSEIDIPPFAEEGTNTASMIFHVQGYAAATVPPNSVLHNQMTSAPSPSGDPGNPFAVSPNTPSADLLVADPAAPSGTILYPSITARSAGTCTETVYLDSPSNSLLTDQVEIASAPSKAIYIDYLAPKNAAGVTGTTQTFSLKGNNGQTYTAPASTPTIISDYSGTGRTLYRWTIPANLAQVPGTYQIRQVAPLTVTLEAGCSGTYQNDLTLGYGTAITKCVWDDGGTSFAQSAPLAPSEDNELDTNGSPIIGNYCGFSAPLTVAPVNPGFSVDKTVQGNLDAAPVSSGGVGDISPAGGVATYKLTFTNTGLSNLHDPVMYDLLPRVGDTEASATTPRGSQFPVTLTGLGTLPTGVTVSYSTTANPCRPEVLATNPGCVDDWSTTAPSPLSSTTALKIADAGTIPVAGTFTVPYSVSTPIVTAGQVANNSVGTNVFAGDNLLGAAESSVTGLSAAGGVPTITKSADVPSYDSGDTIGYTYTVTNNASVPLTGVGVIDNLTDAASGDVAPTVTCQSLSTPAATCSGATTTLAPGQVATFTADYAVKQGDLDHGLIKDTATVTGHPPTGGVLTNTSNEVTVTTTATAALTLTQTVNPTSITKTGDIVTFHFLVHNPGNQTVHGLTIPGSLTGLGAVTCDTTTLAPGADATCQATYTATQADIDAGTITNTATANALSPANAPVVSAPADATVSAAPITGLTVAESASPSSIESVGQVVTFSFLVTNTGNVTLNGVSVVEGNFSGSDPFGTITCPTTTLTPGQSTTCTATDYTVTQTDLDNGSIENSVTATSTGPAGAVDALPSSAAVPIVQTNELDLTKTADVQTVTASGQKIGYSFHIVNAGNATVTGVTVQETSFSGSGSLSAVNCPATDLAPGDDMTCTAGYTVTQADLSTTAITNTAVASGVLPTVSVTSDPSTARVVVDAPAAALLAFTGVYGVASSIAGGLMLLGFGAVLAILGLRRRRRNA
jgi:uncharacterized repeat protein (TIGR01451 family)